MARQITVSLECAGAQLVQPNERQHLVLRQSLYAHHAFEITLPFDKAEGHKTGFLSKAPEQLMGKLFSLKLTANTHKFNKGQQFAFSGVITNLQTGRDNDLATLAVRGFSPCYLLASGLKKRTFVDQTLAAIFQQVMRPFPDNLLPRQLNPQHRAKLPYVVQYQETNFDFLSRLAAEYGEWFCYDGKTMQLGPPPTGSTVNFQADGTYNGFSFSMALKPTSATMYEYDYQQHRHFTSETKSQQLTKLDKHKFSGFALRESEKLFPDAAHVAAETPVTGMGELVAEAKAYKAAAAADLVTVNGYSDNPLIKLGGLLAIEGPGLGSLIPAKEPTESFGTYRVVELSHYVDEEGGYSNTFTAVPDLLDTPPFNPHYDAPSGTPELAEVIDAKDPDGLGRVRVRYPWPVANPRDAETGWLRVLTPYSGAGKGQLFTPEVGSQVIIGYESGLAEQPYVQGNLFHGRNAAGAKYSHNGGEVKGIQTMAGNRITFHDKKGEEKIVITSGKQKDTAIEISFKGKGKIEIKTQGDLIFAAGQNVSIQAGKKLSLKAGELTMQAKSIQGKADSTVELAAASAELKMAGAATQVKGSLTQG